MKKTVPRQAFARPFTLESNFCFARAVSAVRDGAAWSMIWSGMLLFTSVCALANHAASSSSSVG